jgi:hypothetical protein
VSERTVPQPDTFEVESEIHGNGVVSRVKFRASNLEQIAAVLARLEDLAAQPLGLLGVPPAKPAEPSNEEM